LIEPSDAGATATTERRRIRVTGTVQGVGFRPFVYRTATRLGLAGSVSNDAAGVIVEAEGPRVALDALLTALAQEPPPLARVASVTSERLPATGRRGFVVAPSSSAGRVDVPVPADVGPCDACLAELYDPTDRRFRYPFINCTDCGPRYTITHRIPYDRAWTSMAGFTMCTPCQAEYDDPADRRFHAQPNACPTCGPQLELTTPAGAVLARAGAALDATVDRLLAGEVVAVKGVGGYHLAVLAGDEAAVARLRRRKARDDKPFAVLVADRAAAERLVELDDEAARSLRAPARPIVLARRRDPAEVADAVAPGLVELGVMLAPSPLHDLLVREVGRPLVLTSGNRHDEPIAHTDADAHERLAALNDAVLRHDRAIHIRCDDSVLRAGVDGGLQPVRRSRGLAPAPLRLPVGSRRRVLAVGGELKSTIAVATGRQVVLSHHLGDLEHPATYRAFLQAVDHLLAIQEISPEVVAHDLHPEYLSTKFALELDVEHRAVQHHHAHIASCLAEHGEQGPVIGIAFDGLGWGTDGTAWGGELLVCNLDTFERAGHLLPVPMPGGAAAVREPWRMAVSWGLQALGHDRVGEVVGPLDDRWPAVRAVAASGRALPTSSAGRLFDAVAALLGVRSRVSYEGQAAIELEALARSVPVDAVRGGRAGTVTVRTEADGLVLDPSELIRQLVAWSGAGGEPADIAAWFHDELAEGTVEAATRVAGDHGLDTAALSGGVFQNARLTELVAGGLRRAGLRVLVHRLVPPNDGGLSLGQAAIASR
jgi:hydrogenase maturation protein HypF